MQEATQQFVPVQAQRGEVSVGRAPALREDTSTARILNFAQEMNLNNIKNQRAEMYLEGQIEAAQNEGVAETRANRPWVETLFGGGARLSGAMDYMEKAKVLEYQDYLATNMQTLRTQRPEQFKISQVEAVRAFLTDDAETNKRIMNTFTLALPDIARSQAKEHTAFVQEQHIQSMSHAAHAGLTRFEGVRALGVQEDTMRQYGELANILQRPPGMLDTAYKGWLYSLLPVAAKQGNPIVADILQQKGMVTSIDDIAALETAQGHITDYNAEQETMQFGEQHFELQQIADNLEVPFSQFVQEIYKVHSALEETGNKHFTSAIMTSLLNRRQAAMEKEGKQEDYASYLELFRNGQSWDIPSEHIQQVFQLNSAELQQAGMAGDWQRYNRLVQETIVGYSTTHAGDNVMKNRISSSLVRPLQATQDGSLAVSAVTAGALKELDFWHENAPDVIHRQLTEESAAFYTAYRIARENRPAGSEAEWVSDAEQIKTRGRKVGEYATRHAVTATVDLVLDDNKWAATAGEGSLGFMAAASDYAQHYALLYDDPRVAAASVKAALEKGWEVHNGVPFVKVGGRSVDERTGLDRSMWRMEGYLRGTEVFTEGWVSPRITLNGTRESFTIQDTAHPDRIKVVTFDELRGWTVPRAQLYEDTKVTAAQQKARRKLEKTMDSALLMAFTMEQQNLPIGYGPGQRNDPARMDDAAERKLAGMSTAEKLVEYKRLRELGEADTGGWARNIGKFFADALPPEFDPENPPPDFGTLGVAIGNMFGYNKEREDKAIKSLEQLLEITGE